MTLLCKDILGANLESILPRTVKSNISRNIKNIVSQSQLESTAREKLEEFTVSDIELLSSKYRNQLAKIIEQKPSFMHTSTRSDRNEFRTPV